MLSSKPSRLSSKPALSPRHHALSFAIFGVLMFLLIVLTSVDSFAACTPGELCNPLGDNVVDVRIVVGRVIKAILGISGVAALLMFVWGGFQWLISGGSPEKVKKGKETLTWAVIGLVVIFTAYILVSALIRTLTSGAIISV